VTMLPPPSTQLPSFPPPSVGPPPFEPPSFVAPRLIPPPAVVADAAIEITGLTKRFGDLFAVKDLTMSIPRGSVFGLIGPNGAGKSTTFAVLATLLVPTAGVVRIAGHDPIAEPREVRKRMGYMPDTMGVYDSLRVDEYLRFFAASCEVPKAKVPKLIDELLELVDLSTKRMSMVDSLSRGMKQRLSLARALVHDPEVLVLDEPASGLDPRARVDLKNLIGELRSMGKTIVISSHILAELEEMCTDVAILEAGELRAIGTPGAIMSGLRDGRTMVVRLVGGEQRTFEVANDEEQSALLRRLVVDEGLDVLEFSIERRNLESAFMQLTEGIVQ
jgi:ABC-2 type transport system ATP-binding protein